MMRIWLVLASALILGGCDLYFGGGGDDGPCIGGTRPPEIGYRDPVTATCISSGYCDSSCGPCPADAARPDAGPCVSECTGLSEQTCQSTPRCYTTYEIDEYTDGPPAFAGCYQTAPSGPIQGTCEGLDAWACSRHDDCAMVYNRSGAATKFAACVSEPTTYCLSNSECGTGSHCDHSICYPPPGCDPGSACPEVCYGVCRPDSVSCASVDCGPGYHCEEQCYTDSGDPLLMDWCTTACVPDNLSCDLMDCGPGYVCVETCELTGNGMLWCGAYCTPDNTDPGSCYGDVLCDSIPPACPSGTTAGILNGCWSGYCIPLADCDPSDPGECYAPVACDALPPACPSGTTAGVKDGCWTGYCIPDHHCDMAHCEALQSESACQSRWDCTPVYTGTNCTCTVNGCTCESLSWQRCETLYMPF